MASCSSRSFFFNNFTSKDATPSLSQPNALQQSTNNPSIQSVPLSLPLIDLINHSFDNNCRVTVASANVDSGIDILNKPHSFNDLLDSSNSIIIQSVKDIPQPAPLSLNYGNHGNDHFLCQYGFILDDNPYDFLLLGADALGDRVELAVEMSGEATVSSDASPKNKANHTLTDWKKSIATDLAKMDITTSFRLFRHHIDRRVLATIALSLAPLDLPEMNRNVNYFLDHAKAIEIKSNSTQNSGNTDESVDQSYDSLSHPPVQDLSLLPISERRAIYTYLSILQSAFPTTIQKDIELLGELAQQAALSNQSNDNTNSPQKEIKKDAQLLQKELAIRFRMAKKRIIQDQLQKIKLII
jgi:hypothetical protein